MPGCRRNNAATGLESSSAVLKRASRSAQLTANSSASAQPKPPISCTVQRYKSTAGATPKLTKSESESSSAPKRLVPPRRRATRPSSPSRITATTIAITAGSHRPIRPKRIDDSPAQSAATVRMLGSMRLSEGRLIRAWENLPRPNRGRLNRELAAPRPGRLNITSPPLPARRSPSRLRPHAGPAPPAPGCPPADRHRPGCRSG